MLHSVDSQCNPVNLLGRQTCMHLFYRIIPKFAGQPSIDIADAILHSVQCFLRAIGQHVVHLRVELHPARCRLVRLQPGIYSILLIQSIR